EPFAPRCGGIRECDDRYFVIDTALFVEGPQGWSSCMGVAIRDLLCEDAPQHARPLTQGHRARARLPNVVEVRAPHTPDAVEARQIREMSSKPGFMQWLPGLPGK